MTQRDQSIKSEINPNQAPLTYTQPTPSTNAIATPASTLAPPQRPIQQRSQLPPPYQNQTAQHQPQIQQPQPPTPPKISCKLAFQYVTIDASIPNTRLPLLLKNDQERLCVRLIERFILSNFNAEYPPQVSALGPLSSEKCDEEEYKLLNEINEMNDYAYAAKNELFSSEDNLVNLDDFLHFYTLLKIFARPKPTPPQPLIPPQPNFQRAIVNQPLAAPVPSRQHQPRAPIPSGRPMVQRFTAPSQLPLPLPLPRPSLNNNNNISYMLQNATLQRPMYPQHYGQAQYRAPSVTNAYQQPASILGQYQPVYSPHQLNKPMATNPNLLQNNNNNNSQILLNNNNNINSGLRLPPPPVNSISNNFPQISQNIQNLQNSQNIQNLQNFQNSKSNDAVLNKGMINGSSTIDEPVIVDAANVMQFIDIEPVQQNRTTALRTPPPISTPSSTSLTNSMQKPSISSENNSLPRDKSSISSNNENANMKKIASVDAIQNIGQLVDSIVTTTHINENINSNNNNVSNKNIVNSCNSVVSTSVESICKASISANRESSSVNGNNSAGEKTPSQANKSPANVSNAGESVVNVNVDCNTSVANVQIQKNTNEKISSSSEKQINIDKENRTTKTNELEKRSNEIEKRSNELEKTITIEPQQKQQQSELNKNPIEQKNTLITENIKSNSEKMPIIDDNDIIDDIDDDLQIIYSDPKPQYNCAWLQVNDCNVPYIVIPSKPYNLIIKSIRLGSRYVPIQFLIEFGILTPSFNQSIFETKLAADAQQVAALNALLKRFVADAPDLQPNCMLVNIFEVIFKLDKASFVKKVNKSILRSFNEILAMRGGIFYIGSRILPFVQLNDDQQYLVLYNMTLAQKILSPFKSDIERLSKIEINHSDEWRYREFFEFIYLLTGNEVDVIAETLLDIRPLVNKYPQNFKIMAVFSKKFPLEWIESLNAFKREATGSKADLAAKSVEKVPALENNENKVVDGKEKEAVFVAAPKINNQEIAKDSEKAKKKLTEISKESPKDSEKPKDKNTEFNKEVSQKKIDEMKKNVSTAVSVIPEKEKEIKSDVNNKKIVESKGKQMKIQNEKKSEEKIEKSASSNTVSEASFTTSSMTSDELRFGDNLSKTIFEVATSSDSNSSYSSVNSKTKSGKKKVVKNFELDDDKNLKQVENELKKPLKENVETSIGEIIKNAKKAVKEMSVVKKNDALTQKKGKKRKNLAAKHEKFDPDFDPKKFEKRLKLQDATNENDLVEETKKRKTGRTKRNKSLNLSKNSSHMSLNNISDIYTNESEFDEEFYLKKFKIKPCIVKLKRIEFVNTNKMSTKWNLLKSDKSKISTNKSK